MPRYGLWTIKYLLLDFDGNPLQPEMTGERFVVSNSTQNGDNVEVEK